MIGRCNLIAAFMLILVAVPGALLAQDDVTTQNGPNALHGAWITGPASNPLSFLNGPAYRTFGSKMPYDVPDFHPLGQWDARLPRWMNLETEERLRLEGYTNGSFKPGNDDSYWLNRFRFQIDLNLNRWLSVSSQVQDARPFLEKPPIGPPNENRWDLKEAYVQLGDPEKQLASLRVGRQLINYNNTLIANSEWRDQGRSYDAAVLNLHRDAYRLGIFAASVVIPQASGVSPHEEGNNIYGLYGGIDNLIRNSRLEPFVLWRVQPSVAVKGATFGATGKENMKVYGLRFKGGAMETLDYSVQADVEAGSDGTNTIRAWSLTGGAGYQFDSNPWHLRIFGQYDFASGDNNPSDNTHRTFDTIYPTAHDRFGILDLFGWQNMQSVRGGAMMVPRHRWTVTAQWLDFWLAAAQNAAYNSSGGAIVRNSNGLDGKHIGEETDIYTWYELNRHLNIGAGIGDFEAGRFISTTTNTQFSRGPYFAINFKDAGRAERR
jgi:hypothetical protein